MNPETMDERVSRLNAEKRHPSTSLERRRAIETEISRILFRALGIDPSRSMLCPGSIVAPQSRCLRHRTR